MQIDPRISMLINFLWMLASGIAMGAVKFTGLVANPVAAQIVGWSAFVAFVMATANAVLHGSSSAQPGPWVSPAQPSPPVPPVVGKMALFLAAGLVCTGLMLGLPCHAEAKEHVRIHALATPKKLAVIDNVVRKLETIARADVQASVGVAKSGNDANGAACFQAVATLITDIQSVDAKPLPKVHLITDFEKAHLIVMALRQGSAFSAACAPLAEEVKLDLLTFLADIAAGTLSLSTFGL